MRPSGFSSALFTKFLLMRRDARCETLLHWLGVPSHFLLMPSIPSWEFVHFLRERLPSQLYLLLNLERSVCFGLSRATWYLATSLLGKAQLLLQNLKMPTELALIDLSRAFRSPES